MKKALGMSIVLAVVAGAVAAVNPDFVGGTNLGNVGRQIGLHGVLALGAGLVIIAGGIDLSIGSVVAFTGLLFALAIEDWGFDPALAFAITLGGAAAIGALQGLLIAAFRLQPFIVTLCGLFIVRGLGRFLTEDESQGLGSGDRDLAVLVEGSFLSVPWPLWIFLGFAAVLATLLHLTVLGRHLFALGSNEQAARFAGLRTAGLKVLVYTLSAVHAGIGGILFLLYTNTLQPANAGLGYELYAIAAAVLGGVSLRGGSGTVLGIVVGTALIRVLVNATNIMRVPTYLDTTLVGGAILLGVLLDELSRRHFRRSRR